MEEGNACTRTMQHEATAAQEIEDLSFSDLEHRL